MARPKGAKNVHPEEWKPAFLAALRKLPNVLRAAHSVGVHRSLVYKAREADPEFAAEWDEAIGDAIEEIEARSMQMAKSTDPRANALRIFLLKAWKPERYLQATRFDGNLALSGRLQHEHSIDLSNLTDEELDSLERLVGKIAEPGSDTGREGTPPADDDLDAL